MSETLHIFDWLTCFHYDIDEILLMWR